MKAAAAAAGSTSPTRPSSLAKAAAVRDSLERLGGFRDLPIRPIIPAPDTFHYRNKMEFAFHPDGILGLHPRGAWYDIIRLNECFLESPEAVTIVKAAQAFVESRGISCYHPRSQQGLLRELCVRQSRGTGEILLGIVTSPGDFPEGEAMAAHLAKVVPHVAGVVRSIRKTADGAAPPTETTVLFGQDHITEICASLRFRIHMETFFQTNSAQAERLVEVVKELAGDVAGAKVVDVYCGVGLFSLALAAAGAHVVGVEIVEAAIEAARRNAAENGLASPVFHAGDARKVLAEVLPAGPFAQGSDSRSTARGRGRQGHAPDCPRLSRTHRLRFLQPHHAGPRPRRTAPLRLHRDGGPAARSFSPDLPRRNRGGAGAKPPR